MVRYTPSEDVIAREVGGEEVLLDMRSGTYFSLNAVGTAIWQQIEVEPCAIDTLCAAVVREFDVARDTAREDIAALVDDLLARGLIAEVA